MYYFSGSWGQMTWRNNRPWESISPSTWSLSPQVLSVDRTSLSLRVGGVAVTKEMWWPRPTPLVCRTETISASWIDLRVFRRGIFRQVRLLAGYVVLLDHLSIFRISFFVALWYFVGYATWWTGSYYYCKVLRSCIVHHYQGYRSPLEWRSSTAWQSASISR